MSNNNGNEPTKLEDKSGRVVPIAPVAMSWSISQGTTASGMCVVVNVQTAEGDRVFFLEPQVAKDIADALVKMAEASENGIVYKD
jgi:hypothetical protein